MEAILKIIFPKQKLAVEPEDMATVLGYAARVARSAEPAVESAVVRGPRPVNFTAGAYSPVTKFVGNGSPSTITATL